jgi:hypothetical protein
MRMRHRSKEEWERLDECLAYIEATCAALEEKANKEGIENLSPSQRAVGYSAMATGVVRNGGFYYFYEGSDETQQVAKAYELLGFDDAARAFRESASAFPKGVVPTDRERRIAWMEAHEEELERYFEPLNEVIYLLDSQFYSDLEAFIRNHPEEFEGFAPK